MFIIKNTTSKTESESCKA